MGRKSTKNLNLPPRMRVKITSAGKRYYYYDVGGKPRRWKALGGEFVEALHQYAELEQGQTTGSAVITFRHVAERYMREIIPTKAPRTQQDNLAELKSLYKFFDNPPAPITQIRPINIRQYFEWRKEAPVRANREIALFSHIYNNAREWGYTEQANPCVGIRRNKEDGRDVYVNDPLYQLIWSLADYTLRDALDLAYLTGQRPADVLELGEQDIQDNILYIRQNKTRAPLRIEIIGELAKVIKRIRERKKTLKVHALSLIVNEQGQPLTQGALRSRFDKVRVTAGIDKNSFQFRDLRAKAATEKEDKEGMAAAKDQLGHKSEAMTRRYVRHRLGKKVTPTK